MIAGPEPLAEHGPSSEAGGHLHDVHLLAQGTVEDLQELVNTESVTGWDFAWAGIALVVGGVVGRLGRNAIRRYGRHANLPGNTIDLVSTVVQWAVFALAVVIALTFLGLDLAPLWILIVIVTVVFVVGGRTLVEAFGAGITLQARAPFAPGDLVQIGDHQGVVREVNSRVVVVDAIDGRRIFLPNQQVLNSPIVNLTHRRLRMSTLYLDVVYGSDLDRACEIAVDALTGVDEILSRPAPQAEVTAFEASSIRIQLRFWHESDLPSEWAAVDVAARATASAFRAGGIDFAFPQATLWWGDGQQPPASPTD